MRSERLRACLHWLFVAIVICSLTKCSQSPPGSVEASENIREEQVGFRNGNVSLKGSLFLPAGNGAHPALVLFHGSGAEARNRFMGRWFAEQGISALTYDKRGVGESGGDFRTVRLLIWRVTDWRQSSFYIIAPIWTLNT